MALFREEYLTIQDDYLRVDPSTEESGNDEDLEYSNDDLGENTEITPLGDAVKDDELNDFYKIGPEEDDFDDDLDIDLDTDDVEEDEEIQGFSDQIDPLDDDDDDLDADDDLLDDDDDLDTSISPDLDDDDDLLDDDDDLADDDLNDDDTVTPRSSIDTNADFSSRPHGRVTGTMLDHDPGLPG